MRHGAPREKQIALGPLNFLRKFILRPAGGSGLIAENEKDVWIPVRLRAPTCVRCHRKPVHLPIQTGKDGMFADTPKPVGRVRGIGFDPMHDGMPVASFARGNILGDFVTQFPVPGHEKKAGERGPGIARLRKELLRTRGQQVARQLY